MAQPKGMAEFVYGDTAEIKGVTPPAIWVGPVWTFHSNVLLNMMSLWMVKPNEDQTMATANVELPQSSSHRVSEKATPFTLNNETSEHGSL